MSGGTDYGGLIIDDDKNLTRKMYRGGKQQKHGGNERLNNLARLIPSKLRFFSFFANCAAKIKIDIRQSMIRKISEIKFKFFGIFVN